MSRRNVFAVSLLLLSIFSLNSTAANAAPSELFGTSLIADIAEKVSPAVVAIESVQYVRARRRAGSGDPFLDQFFGHLFDDDFMGHNNVIPKRGNGSGVLISPDGHLLTNEHVIADADEIQVKLNNGKSFKATIIGKDTLTDLAVLKIEADNAAAHTHWRLFNHAGWRMGYRHRQPIWPWHDRYHRRYFGDQPRSFG